MPAADAETSPGWKLPVAGAIRVITLPVVLSAISAPRSQALIADTPGGQSAATHRRLRVPSQAIANGWIPAGRVVRVRQVLRQARICRSRMLDTQIVVPSLATP